MIFFRNLTLYRFTQEIAGKLRETLAESLAEHQLRECGPLELATRGFVSPYGRGAEELVHAMQDFRLISLGGWDKVLPAAVVNEELRHRVSVIVEREARRVGARERKRLKDEVLHDLLQRAFCRRVQCNAYLDLAGGWLVVDTSSRRTAEEVITHIREAVGTFPCVPMSPEESPRSHMTEWVVHGKLPKGYVLGDEAELRDPVETGAVVRIRRQDMETDEVREHLKSGKQVFQLGVTFDDRLSFVLSEDLQVRKFRLLDVVLDEMGEADDAGAELESSFALMVMEVQRLLASLASIFGIPDVPTLRLEPRPTPKSMLAMTTEKLTRDLKRSLKKKGLSVSVCVGGDLGDHLNQLQNAPDDVRQWLRSGSRGSSSETICAHLSGIDVSGAQSHPLDPGDLGRCRKLLEAVPAFRARLHEMRSVSGVWANLVDAWDELCALMDEEVPNWRSGKGKAQKTYDRMQELAD